LLQILSSGCSSADGLSHNRYNATSGLLCFARSPRATELDSVDALSHDQPATNTTQASADVEHSLNKDVSPFPKTAREHWLVERFDWLPLENCSRLRAMFHVSRQNLPAWSITNYPTSYTGRKAPPLAEEKPPQAKTDCCKLRPGTTKAALKFPYLAR
jgi:hypothetical protein